MTMPMDLTLVRCDCGRQVAADTMTDVSALPASLRGTRMRVCGACRERWRLAGVLARAELAALAGAPAAQVARIAAKHGEPVPPTAAACVTLVTTRLDGQPLPSGRLRVVTPTNDVLATPRAAMTDAEPRSP